MASANVVVSDEINCATISSFFVAGFATTAVADPADAASLSYRFARHGEQRLDVLLGVADEFQGARASGLAGGHLH